MPSVKVWTCLLSQQLLENIGRMLNGINYFYTNTPRLCWLAYTFQGNTLWLSVPLYEKQFSPNGDVTQCELEM